MWDLSFLARHQTSSPALEGGFLTTGSPGKSLPVFTDYRPWALNMFKSMDLEKEGEQYHVK